MARRRRARRGGAGWWVLGALAAIASWLGFRATQGSLDGSAGRPVAGVESALDGGPRAATSGIPAASPVAAAGGEVPPDAPSPTASPGPGIAARGAGAPAKPAAREHLDDDDRKALEAVLDRSSRKQPSR